jgi:hypothetical protein
VGDTNMGKRAYLATVRAENAEVQAQIKADAAATVILKYARRFLARKLRLRMRRERRAAIRIQRGWRWRMATLVELKRQRAEKAVCRLQAAYRGYYTRVYWASQLRPWLRERRARRIIAKWLEKVVPGRRARLMYAVMRLKAAGPKRFEDWQDVLKRAGRPIRTYGIFEEYYMPDSKGVCVSVSVYA